MTKEFDPTKPVQTRAGRPARILCTDYAPHYYNRNILAIVTYDDGHEVVWSYRANGSFRDNGKEDNLDLVNVPVKKYYNIYRGNNYNGIYGPYDSKGHAASRARLPDGSHTTSYLGCLEVEE
jgi:hypothetical protein